MNDKKKKLFVRVLCFILALIMVMGLVIQVAFAEEGCPYEALDGFEFVSNGDGWDVVKTSDKPVIRLSNVPDDFVNPDVTVLVANLDTNATQVVHLFPFNGYTATLDIDDGYYIIYTNDLMWKSTTGTVYGINDNSTIYFYKGNLDNFDAEKYYLNYIFTDAIINLPLIPKQDISGYHVIDANITYHRTQEESLYPVGEVYNWEILAELAVAMDWDKYFSSGEVVLLDEANQDEENNKDIINYIQNNPNINTIVPEMISNFKDEYKLDMTSSETPSVETANGLNIETAKPEEIVTETVDTEPTTITPTENNEKNDVIHDTLNNISENIGLGEITYKTPAQLLWDSIKKSWFLILLLIAGSAGYLYVQNKNRKTLEEQIENDTYDDSRIE